MGSLTCGGRLSHREERRRSRVKSSGCTETGTARTAPGPSLGPCHPASNPAVPSTQTPGSTCHPRPPPRPPVPLQPHPAHVSPPPLQPPTCPAPPPPIVPLPVRPPTPHLFLLSGPPTACPPVPLTPTCPPRPCLPHLTHLLGTHNTVTSVLPQGLSPGCQRTWWKKAYLL